MKNRRVGYSEDGGLATFDPFLTFFNNHLVFVAERSFLGVLNAGFDE